jgi:hypothetical protein
MRNVTFDVPTVMFDVSSLHATVMLHGMGWKVNPVAVPFTTTSLFACDE